MSFDEKRKLPPSDKCLLVQRVKVGFLKRKSKKNLFHLKGGSVANFL
ncbi:hypothetical protein [Methanosarcina mazei]|jgi:hypothetical protein